MVVERDCDRREVIASICDIAERCGDGYSPSQMKWHEGVVYDGRDKAEEAIDRFDSGWYSDHAVLFRDYSGMKRPGPTAKMVKMADRLERARCAEGDYTSRHHIYDAARATVSCSKCSSRLAVPYLKRDQCPVCGNDLRSEAVLRRIGELHAKVEGLEDELRGLRDEQEERFRAKAKSSAPVRWLVKYEYHC
jgi:hypothetical protein